MAADDALNRLKETAYLAGRYHQSVKDDPSLEGGFGRLRDKFAAEAEEIAEELRAQAKPRFGR